ncbi:hypothetical protein TL16_g02388 [Triparma laevis f. inornata]|uniref:Uncharacterized protein n=1 Tax=Triparma laevis f. inornata TaxID=1714386 RepID=A0A9W6ZSW9_9STRA|nr:hypothetical protein TL16_g02388 [Triparma laevis f. inornata]
MGNSPSDGSEDGGCDDLTTVYNEIIPCPVGGTLPIEEPMPDVSADVSPASNANMMFSPALKSPSLGTSGSAFSPVRRTRKRSKKALAISSSSSSSSSSLVSPPLQHQQPQPQAPLGHPPRSKPKPKPKPKPKSKSIFGFNQHDENVDPNSNSASSSHPPPIQTSGTVSYVCHDDEDNPQTSSCDAKTINGTKCYIIDAKTGCFVFQLLTPEECRSLIQSAESHVQSSAGGSGWRKLYTYTKMDLPMQDLANAGVVDEQGQNIKESLMRRICSVVASYYGCSASALRPRTWKEPHFLKYSTDVAPPHCGVEMHYDGCNITWNLMLSDETDYDGGGTYIRCLRKTVKLLQGQVLIHPGGEPKSNPQKNQPPRQF